MPAFIVSSCGALRARRVARKTGPPFPELPARVWGVGNSDYRYFLDSRPLLAGPRVPKRCQRRPLRLEPAADHSVGTPRTWTRRPIGIRTAKRFRGVKGGCLWRRRRCAVVSERSRPTAPAAPRTSGPPRSGSLLVFLSSSWLGTSTRVSNQPIVAVRASVFVAPGPHRYFRHDAPSYLRAWALTRYLDSRDIPTQGPTYGPTEPGFEVPVPVVLVYRQPPTTPARRPCLSSWCTVVRGGPPALPDSASESMVNTHPGSSTSRTTREALDG